MFAIVAAILIFIVIGAIVLLLAQTHGRCGPIAAVAFVLGGPVLGVVLIIPLGFQWTDQPRGQSPPNGLYGLDPVEYFTAMFLLGLLAAAAASAAYTISSDEGRAAIDLDPQESPPYPVPSAALRAFRLPPWATAEQVEAAYQEDRSKLELQGADEGELVRLRKRYERALRFVGARTKPADSSRTLS
jgi:hypothetical protein